MTDLFQEARERVPMEEAARRYGFEPDRQHRIRCPFHEDDHPSLQLYRNGRGWWCYVCGTGGSVIDFVAKLFGLSPREAALKLNADFSLGLTGERPRALERRAQSHNRLLQNRKKESYRQEYARKENWFIVLRRELLHTEHGGCRGQLLGWMDELNEWFQNHPWR